jgi:transcriptional regulator
VPKDTLNRMMRQILPFRFAIDHVDGTWKLGQNKPDAARAGAAAGIAVSDIGQNTQTLGETMVTHGTGLDKT